MKISKIMIVHPEVYDMHLNKDPFVYPRGFKALGVETVLMVDKNHLTKTTPDLPRIIELKNKRYNIKLNKLSSIFKYIVGELKCAKEISDTAKKERTNAILFYDDPIFFVVIKILNPSIPIIWKFDTDGRIEELPYSQTVAKLSYSLKHAFSDMVVIASNDAYKRVLTNFPYFKRKMKFIPNGIPDVFFLDRRKTRKRRNVILCVARVARVKGYDILLRSFADIREARENWSIRIAGPIEDNIYYKELLELIKKLGLEKHVKFLGMISEKKLLEEYRIASIFCLVSYKEGSAASRVEAMAAGLPVITTKTGGSELVDGGGIIIKVGDVEELTDALDRLMKDSKLRRQMGAGAKSIAIKMRARKSAKKLIDELQKIDH